MRYDLLADIAAFAALLMLLVSLRRRHPDEPVNLWLAGMILIFGEAVAHFFYVTPGPWHRASHIVALNCFALAGYVFIWGAFRAIFSSRSRNIYTFANAPPLLFLLTLYGAGVLEPLAFYVGIGVSLVVGVGTILYLRLSRFYLISRVLILGLMAWNVRIRDFRQAVYLGLFYLFLLVALGFYRSLPSRSTGKWAVITGFFTWALIFLTHVWVAQHPRLDIFADELWNLQAFVVAIGMLLVLLERQIARNEHLALHDPLTGLPNRRLLNDRLCQAVLESERMGTRVALMILDLDGFKAVNDSLGHEAGDQFLCEVSRALRKTLRNYNTLARFGGDEFAILSPGLPHLAEQARSAANVISANVRKSLAEPLTVNSETRAIPCSIGFAIYPDDAREIPDLLRLADLRMYEHKRSRTGEAAAAQRSLQAARSAADWPLPGISLSGTVD